MVGLIGNFGNNRFTATRDVDVIDGGFGFDVVDYSGSRSGVNVNLTAATQLGGDALGDTLISIEGVIGSDYADSLTGDAGNNSLVGGRGADTLSAGSGDDTIDSGVDRQIDIVQGGKGIDTLTYATASKGLVVDMALGETRTRDFTISPNGIIVEAPVYIEDQFSSIEIVVGSNFSDVMKGSAAADTLLGGAGNDTLLGRAGADIITGGDGADYLSGGSNLGAFGNDGARDSFMFNTVTEIGVGAAHDQISGFEYGVDKIDFSAIDADATLAGNQAFHISNGVTVFGAQSAQFDGSAGALTVTPYATNSSDDFGVGYTIQGDINGDSIADFELSVYGGRNNALGNLGLNDLIL
jgi:Ca2+-binding RTX toxin-like protein